jgi:hypothetical protein
MGRSAVSARDPGRLLGVVAGVLLLGAAAGLATTLIMRHQAAGLAALCLLIAPLPIVVRLVQHRFDAFEPIQVIALTFFILYALRPAAELIWNIQFFDLQYARGGFNGAAAISAVGMLSLYVGYALSSGATIARRLPSVPDMWDPERSVRFGIWVLVACALLTAMFAATVGPSTLFHFYWGGRTTTDYLTFLTVVGYVALGPYLTIPAAIIFGFAYARLRTLKTLALFVFSLGIAMFLTFPRGDRTYILALVLPLLVFPYLRKNKRPAGLAVLLAVIGAILAMNILLSIRHVDARQPIGKALVGAVTHVGTQLKDFATGVDLGEFSVLELEHEAYYTKTNPLTFHPGQTLLSAAAYPLPRKLVGTKPKAAGQWVVDRLFPTNTTNRSSFNPAMFGDFFSDFGWVTIVLYDIIVGIVARVLWEYFVRHKYSEGVQILFAATLPILVIMVRNSVVDAFARSLFLTGPLLLCLIVCSRQRVRRFAGYRAPPEAKAPVVH